MTNNFRSRRRKKVLFNLKGHKECIMHNSLERLKRNNKNSFQTVFEKDVREFDSRQEVWYKC